MNLKLLISLPVLLCLSWDTLLASGGGFQWNNSAGGDWNDGGNWDADDPPPFIPDIDSFVEFNLSQGSPGYIVTLSLDPTEVQGLEIEDDFVTIDGNGNELSIGDQFIIAHNTFDNATLIIKDGLVEANSLSTSIDDDTTVSLLEIGVAGATGASDQGSLNVSNGANIGVQGQST